MQRMTGVLRTNATLMALLHVFARSGFSGPIRQQHSLPAPRSSISIKGGPRRTGRIIWGIAGLGPAVVISTLHSRLPGCRSCSTRRPTPTGSG